MGLFWVTSFADSSLAVLKLKEFCSIVLGLAIELEFLPPPPFSVVYQA